MWMNQECFLNRSEENSEVIIFKGNSTSEYDIADKAQKMLGSPLKSAATLDHNDNEDLKTVFQCVKWNKRYQQPNEVVKHLAVK